MTKKPITYDIEHFFFQINQKIVKMLLREGTLLPVFIQYTFGMNVIKRFDPLMCFVIWKRHMEAGQ